MWLPVTDQVIVPWPTVWIFSADPSAEPEFATPETPIVLPENVPVWIDEPVVFTMSTPGPTASRNVLLVMLMVAPPLVPSLTSESPPPPVAIPGWLFENAFPDTTRSPRPLPLWM